MTFWDVAARRQRGTPCVLERGAASLAFSPDGRTLATSDLGGVVRFWDVDTRRPRGTLTYAGCRTVTFSPDARYLAAARDGGDVVLWDVRDGRQLGLLNGHRGRVTRIVFTPDGRRLATAGD